MKQSYFAITLLCYLLAVVLWMVQGLITFLYEGGLPPLYLGLSQAEFVDVSYWGDGHYETHSADGQIILNDLDISGGLVVLEGEFQAYPGELDLYFKREGEEGYSVHQRVFAFPLEGGGGYGYRLLPGNYSGLRLDTGTEPGNVLVAERLIVHPQRSVLEYFQFSFRRLMVLLLLPPLVSCVIYTIIEWSKLIKTRKKMKREPL